MLTATEYFGEQLARRDGTKQVVPINNQIPENPYEALPETMPIQEAKIEEPTMAAVASNVSIEQPEVKKLSVVPSASNESIGSSQEGTESS